MTMRKLEAVSYVAVILASTLLCVELARGHYRSPQPETRSVGRTNAQGKNIAIPGVDWSHTNRSLVVAISTHCPFCVGSTPFYSTLAGAQNHAHNPIQLIAVLPEATQSGREFLHAHQVNVDQVANAPLSTLQVEATPTLLLVDAHGKVIKEWVGKLTPDGEKQVINAMLE